MISFKHLVIMQLKRRNNLLSSLLLRQLNPTMTVGQFAREKHKRKDPSGSVGSLFQPVPVKSNPRDTDIGSEITGALDKGQVITTLNTFMQKKAVKELALQYGLDDFILQTALNSFRQYCVESEALPVDLHIVLSDIIQGSGNPLDIFPYFMRYTKQLYPHIECLDDLKKISDLRDPPNWYSLARAKQRKIIFHAGPTNSGKTHHALERFMKAKSGVYCGPLKLLAAEVFKKCNDMGTPCDLITGEERRYVNGELSPSNHIACSIEMVNIENTYEVAVLDEIQLLRDASRGWAWTRALLGIAANEIHLCGEAAAIPIVKSICETTKEEVEVRQYKRLTELVLENRALGTLSRVEPGDCIVCFNKNDIFTVTQTIEKMKKQVAVIYGSLPPGTKLAQAARFNDINNPCKILVATNAIGMGLNLHIRRIIFYSINQPVVNEKGEKEIDTISVSSALQIAGRAGRYGTQWSQGYVTTFKHEDLPILSKLLSQTPEKISQVGLHPTADQIELYAYYLPNAPLSNLIDIFVALSQVNDSLYFICNLDDFKFLADMIQHIPLPLRMRYVFCCAPINRKLPFLCSMFLKFARQCSKNKVITIAWLCKEVNWPLTPPGNINDLVHLEAVFDAFDIYLWLSYRFTDLFPHADLVRQLQTRLDELILLGIQKLRVLFQTENLKVTLSQHKDKESQIEKYFHSKGAQTSKSIKGGRLTDMLLSEGLLTPKMLQQLQSEWSNTNKTENKEETKSDYKNNNYHAKKESSIEKPKK